MHMQLRLMDPELRNAEVEADFIASEHSCSTACIL